MKKLLTLLTVLLFLTGCGSNSTKSASKEIDTSKYIDRAVLVNYVDFLNDETKAIVKAADTTENGISNKDLLRLGKPLCAIKVTDYNGKELNFVDLQNKKVILEVVAEWCGNCQSQAKNLTPKLLETLPSDVVFIQYFNVGTVDQINEFYKKLEMPVPSNIIILPQNDELKNYLTNDLLLEYYPSFLFFNNGILTWSSWGDFTSDSYKKVEDIAFKNPLDLSKLVDNDGNTIFANGRSTADVMEDLSEESINKLKAIDPKGNNASLNTTLKIIGTPIDYSKISKVDKNDTPLIEDFSKYKDEDVIVLYTTIDPDYIESDYKLFNEIIAANPDQKFIVLLKQTDEGTKNNIKYNNEIVGAEVSMGEANVPDDLLDLQIDRVPVAVFVEKGVVTGAITAIENADMVKNNISVFFGDGSVALKSNNTKTN